MKYLHFAFQAVLLIWLAGCSTPGGANSEEATAVTGTEPKNTDAQKVSDVLGTPLSANDVTFLFPLPTRAEELDNLIAIGDLVGSDARPVFPQKDFEQIVTLAESPASSVGDRQIRFNTVARDFSHWVIAGIRFDPSAPGSSKAVIETFGSRPQIRLVLQPVSTSGQQVVVEDVALHVIYDYVTSIETSEPGVVGRSVPDRQKVSAIVSDLIDIKTTCEQLGVDTGGLLRVHPGLVSEQAGVVSAAIKAFLATHLTRANFNSGAIMGLNNGGPEPWIFLSLLRAPGEDGGFIPVPSPGLGSVAEQRFAQMISFIDSPNVQPKPSTANRVEFSADLRRGQSERRGVSTAVLFTESGLAAPAPVGVDAGGAEVVDTELINADIVDWVANPEKSHFFNTDCISCHTESTRRVILEFPRSRFAFPLQNSADVAARPTMPTSQWNVRNLGWFANKATISTRTENETLEVVEFINREIIKAFE